MNNLMYHVKLVGASSLNIKSILPKKIQPILANLKLTENCNAMCITCDYWRTTHKIGISTKRAIQLLAEIYEHKIKNVRFTGGEPLLRKDLFEICETRNQDDFNRVTLGTNGLLLDRFKDQVNNSIITNVTVSLDAIGENNDKIRGIKGYYDTVLRGLGKINKQIKIVSTLTSVLTNDLEDLILLCKNKGYGYDVNLPENSLYFFSSENVKKTLKAIKPNQNDINKTMEILARYDILSDKLIQNARLYLTKGKFDFSHCIQGYVELDIDSNGSVRTGCNVFKPVGNINNSSLAEIISSKPYKDSVLKMYKFDCPGCACGYGVSVVYKNPISSLGYIKNR